MRRILLLAVPLLVLVPSPVLAAEGDPESGWWSQTKLGAASPVEAPDTVPEGGLQVAGDPGGPVSVAAVRVAPTPGSRVSGLRLQVARATGDVQVQVCATAARWRPVDGDRLDAAPPADCEALSVLAQVTDGVLVVDLPPGSGGLALDVRLQPVTGAVFGLDLAPVTAASVRSEPVAAAPPPAAPAPAPPAAPGGDTGPALAPGSAPAPPPADPLPAPEPVLAGEAPVPDLASDLPLAVPPDLPAAAPPVLAAPAAPVAGLVPRPPGPEGRREQLAALALLAGLVALGVGLQRAPARAPQRLGGAARLAVGVGQAGEATTVGRPPVEAALPQGGVGRFRGPRDRPPVAL